MMRCFLSTPSSQELHNEMQKWKKQTKMLNGEHLKWWKATKHAIQSPQPEESCILSLNHSWGKQSLSVHLYLQTLITAISLSLE